MKMLSKLLSLVYTLADILKTYWQWLQFTKKPPQMTSNRSARTPASNGLDSLGVAIAFGYYLYLKDAAFKKLDERITDFMSVNGIKLTARKILILVPKLCETSQLDFGKLVPVGNLDYIEKDIHGIKGRKYSLTVYNIKPGGQDMHFILDTTHCLDVLFKIHLRNNLELPDAEKLRVTDQFLEVLKFLLDTDYPNHYTIITYTSINGEGESTEDDDVPSVIANNYYMKVNDNRNYFEDMPRPVTMTLKNLGYGLALWYFYNYLCKTAPNLQKNIRIWQECEGVRLDSEKVFILVPHSCECPDFDAIRLKDDRIECAKKLNNPPPREMVGTSNKRSYEKPVYIITDKYNKRHYCVAEFATPIRQLGRMFKECYAKLEPINKSDIIQHRKQFHKELLKLLKTPFKQEDGHTTKYSDLYELVHFIDGANVKLSDVLLQKIRSSKNRG